MKNGIAEEGKKKHPSVDKRRFIKLRSFTSPKAGLKLAPGTDTRRRRSTDVSKTRRKDEDS